jgi:parvulin-like peptidyl-prolyl isomerase
MADFDRVRERLANGENFNDLALEYSEDPSVKNNKGDLGYFERESMVKEFSDAAFSAKAGELVGPVKSSYGYHLIFVEDKKKEKSVEKVKASHILLKIVAGPSTVEDANSKARYFSEDAKADGFEEVARRENLEIKKTGYIQESIDFVPGFGRNLSILNFAFSAELNDVSTVYNTDQGFAVLKLIEIRPEGYRPIESVRVSIESRIKLEKAKEKARTHSQHIAEKVLAGTPFKEIADADTSKKTIYRESQLFTIDQSITGVGKVVDFSANAFRLEVGDKSDLLETDRGFYFQHLLEKTTFDSTAYAEQKKSIKTRLLNEKKNQVFNDWYTFLKSEADIVDNRRQFGFM